MEWGAVTRYSIEEHRVREIVIAPNVINEPTVTIPSLLQRHLGGPGDPVLFQTPTEQGGWEDVTASAFAADVTALAKGLVSRGIRPGDAVALMSRTRYEWTLLDFAIATAGAVSVPIYETSSPSQVAWILQDSGAHLVLVENAGHEAVVHRAVRQEELDGVEAVLQIDGGGLTTLRADGANVSDERLREQTQARRKDDVATLIYTSGTTGRPKGCELTHANFVDLADNALSTLGHIVHEGSSTLMFLPLAHVFGRYIALLAVAAGATVGHTPDLKNLLPDLASFRPTFLLVVPRVLEKVYNGAQQKADDSGKGKIFAAAARTAEDYSRASLSGRRVPLGLRLRHALFDKLVYGTLRQAMGGRVGHAVSGGGPLGERLGHFFNGIGVTVLEGYGLTETTAPIGVNTPEKIKIGTVGRPLPGDGVRIAEDGEILAKGVCVFRGYHGREDLTAEAFTPDGWFRTGDVGELDEDGFLRITGRKKEIIVTAGGKNVIPALLEDQIRAAAVVSQCVVVGEGRKFVGALVTLDEEALPGWLRRHHRPEGTTPEQLREDPELLAEIQAVVDRANESVSHAEAIKKFRVVPTDFTEASGHLTPSLKIKRAVVLKDFAAEVDALYAV